MTKIEKAYEQQISDTTKTVRCRNDEWEQWTKAAALLGLSTAVWLRMKCNRASRLELAREAREEQVEEDLLSIANEPQ